MSLYDLQQRTDLLLKKYAKYDAPLEKQRGSSDEPFTDEYAMLEAQVGNLLQQAEEVAKEGNRAIVATRNAELRRAKQQLLTDGIEGLQKKLKKGKGVTKVIIEERQRRVKALIEKIYLVPDGMGEARQPFKIGAYYGAGPGPGGAVTLSTLGPSGVQADPLYYKSTEETAQFQQEWEQSKKRQDAQLERIERGVGTLADMAKGVQEELGKQTPVIDDIDQQLHRVTTQINGNNAKLKGLVHQMRSSRNFCIDMILIFIVLGIVAYIASIVQKSKQQ